MKVDEREQRFCECGREAVEKVAGPRSPNEGLRYLCCDRFIFFGKKKNYCRFFEWIDQPRVTQEQKKEAQTLKKKKKGAAFVSITALQAENNTKIAVKDSKTLKSRQLNVEKAELKTINTSPQAQICEIAVNAAVDSSVGAQDSLTSGCRQDAHMEDFSLPRPQTGKGQIEDFSGAEQTHGLKYETGTTNLKDTMQPDTQIGHDADFHILQNKRLTLNEDDKQTFLYVHDILETPTCLCLRAALLKTVKSRGPNQGLRYWVCSNSRPFYVKKKIDISKDSEESCKFFRWIDTPSEKSDIQKEEKKQRRKENRKRKELSIIS